MPHLLKALHDFVQCSTFAASPEYILVHSSNLPQASLSGSCGARTSENLLDAARTAVSFLHFCTVKKEWTALTANFGVAMKFFGAPKNERMTAL